MGVEARIVLYAPGEEAARGAAAAAFARMNELDAILSDYRVDSELNRLCAGAGGPAAPVSADLYAALSAALEVAVVSGGAFDPTVGPLTQLWRAARAAGVPPTADEIAAARRFVGYQHVHLDPAARTVRLDLAGMRLDLGGIGKGYACDAAGALLRARAAPRFLIDFGGELLAGDPPPGRAGWRIALADGRELELSGQALSTSGDSQQHLDVGGSRLSHVLDPRSGDALLDSGDVAVLAPTATDADALATACGVLGAARAPALLSQFPPACLIALVATRSAGF